MKKTKKKSLPIYRQTRELTPSEAREFLERVKQEENGKG